MQSRIPQAPAEWVEALRAAGFFTTERTATTIHQWTTVCDERPLVVQGVQYDGKTSLAQALIDILEGEPGAHHTKTSHIYWMQRPSFESLFYEWDGFSRQQAVKVTRELGRSPEEVETYATSPKYLEQGTLLRALRAEHDPAYLLFENFDGPPEEKTDEALAEFVRNRRIHVPELGGHEGRAGGKWLRMIITLSGWTPREKVAQGSFYEALEETGLWLTMDALDRPYQFFVLSSKFPSLPPEAVRDLILFVERFKARPDVDYHPSFGEVVGLAGAVARYRPEGGLDAKMMRRLGGMFAKSHRSSEALERHAGAIMLEVRRTAF